MSRWIIGLLLALLLLRGDLPTNAQAIAPVANLRAEVDGSDVTLRWDPPVYVELRVEAGSAPGLADLGTFDFSDLGIDLRHTFGGVPAGTFYVRVRGQLRGQISGPSNEVVVTVAGCAAPPQIDAFSGRVLGDTVDLTWKGPGPSCGPTTYLLEAGSTPGGSELGVFDIGPGTGSDRTRYWSAAPAPPGHYFVRLRGRRGGVIGSATADVELAVTCLPPKSVFDFRAEVTGSTAVFSWRTDNAWVSANRAVLEVGSGPGLGNLASIVIPDWLGGSPFFTFRASGPPGTYHTRIRTTTPCGSKVTSDVVVTLSGPCMVPGFVPMIDAYLGTFVSGPPRLSVNWLPPEAGGPVESFVVEAGSEPGSADLGVRLVDRAAYTAVFDNVTISRAFVRVRAKNACGEGQTSFEAQAVSGSCRNLPPPQMIPVSVSGNTVTIGWLGYSELGPVVYPAFVEIGTTLFGRDVLVSPVYAPEPHSVRKQFTLPSGRYFARARSMADCGQAGNPTRELAFAIGS